MSTALTEADPLMPPSEALNRDREFADGLLPGQLPPEPDADRLVAHAVRIGTIGLLLPRDVISELVENTTVCRLPNTSTWFSGVTSVRGNMIPVFDLHELFELDYGDLQRKLIVVGENETATAFWVDDFPKMLSLASEEAMSGTTSIPALIRDYARDYYLQDEQVWVDWDIDGFMTTLGEML